MGGVSSVTGRKSLSLETHRVCSVEEPSDIGAEAMPSILDGMWSAAMPLAVRSETRSRKGVLLTAFDAAVVPSMELMSTAPLRSILKSCFTLALLLVELSLLKSLAIALVDQEFVIVDGGYFADARAGGQQVGVLVGVSAEDIDGHDAQQLGGVATEFGILDKSVHDADERTAIGGDGETFHAFVGGPAGDVGGGLIGAYRAQVRNIKGIGQFVGTDTGSGEAAELINIGAVLVGNEARNPSLETRMPSVSKRASLVSPELWLGSKLSERPVKKWNKKLLIGGTPEPTPSPLPVP